MQNRFSQPKTLTAVLAAAALAAGTFVLAPRGMAAEMSSQNPPTATTTAPSAMPNHGVVHRMEQNMGHAMHHPMAAQRRMSPESVDHRIHEIHHALRITRHEDEAWRRVAHVMRHNADRIERLIHETRAKGPRANWTALESLEIYHRFAEAHDRNLDQLTQAFARLYHEMPAAQQKNADMVFRNWRKKHPHHHHHH
ncbi:MAG: hypothetical protein ACREFD_19450 [Stellaceae bacterium]